jgi:hypothetical protein
VLDPLAQAEGHAVENQAAFARFPGDEQLRHVGQRLARPRAAGRLVDRDVTPTEDGQALVRGEVFDQGEDTLSLGGIRGEAASLGKVEPRDRAEKSIGKLRQDAGPVAGVRVGTGRAAVLEIAKNAKGAGHDLVAASGP